MDNLRICAGEEMLMRTTPQILNATKNRFAVMSVDALGTMPPQEEEEEEEFIRIQWIL